MWLAATNGFPLVALKREAKPPVALPQARRAAMGKKQQASPPSETSVAADQLPAAEVLAGELVSAVARNVESGRLSEHRACRPFISPLAPLAPLAPACEQCAPPRLSKVSIRGNSRASSGGCCTLGLRYRREPHECGQP